MSDKLGRINVLRTMIGISMAAMPALYAAGSNVALLYAAVFVSTGATNTTLREWCGGGDFWGTKTRRNYGILFTAGAWPESSGAHCGVLYDRYTTIRLRFTLLRCWGVRYYANLVRAGPL